MKMQNTVTSTSRTVLCLGCSIRRHITLILLILLAAVPKTCQGANNVQEGGEQKPWLPYDNLETNRRHMSATSSRHLQSTSEQEKFCDWYETTIGQSDAYECDCEGRSGEVEDSEDANNVGIFLRCRKFPTPCTPEAWCPQTVVESLLVVSTVRQGNGTTAANNANNLANITEIQFTQTCTTWSLSEHSYTYCVQVQPSQSTAASPDSETLDATWMCNATLDGQQCQSCETTTTCTSATNSTATKTGIDVDCSNVQPGALQACTLVDDKGIAELGFDSSFDPVLFEGPLTFNQTSTTCQLTASELVCNLDGSLNYAVKTATEERLWESSIQATVQCMVGVSSAFDFRMLAPDCACGVVVTSGQNPNDSPSSCSCMVCPADFGKNSISISCDDNDDELLVGKYSSIDCNSEGDGQCVQNCTSAGPECSLCHDLPSMPTIAPTERNDTEEKDLMDMFSFCNTTFFQDDGFVQTWDKIIYCLTSYSSCYNGFKQAADLYRCFMNPMRTTEECFGPILECIRGIFTINDFIQNIFSDLPVCIMERGLGLTQCILDEADTCASTCASQVWSNNSWQAIAGFDDVTCTGFSEQFLSPMCTFVSCCSPCIGELEALADCITDSMLGTFLPCRLSCSSPLQSTDDGPLIRGRQLQQQINVSKLALAEEIFANCLPEGRPSGVQGWIDFVQCVVTSIVDFFRNVLSNDVDDDHGNSTYSPTTIQREPPTVGPRNSTEIDSTSLPTITPSEPRPDKTTFTPTTVPTELPKLGINIPTHSPSDSPTKALQVETEEPTLSPTRTREESPSKSNTVSPSRPPTFVPGISSQTYSFEGLQIRFEGAGSLTAASRKAFEVATEDFYRTKYFETVIERRRQLQETDLSRFDTEVTFIRESPDDTGNTITYDQIVTLASDEKMDGETTRDFILVTLTKEEDQKEYLEILQEKDPAFSTVEAVQTETNLDPSNEKEDEKNPIVVIIVVLLVGALCCCCSAAVVYRRFSHKFRCPDKDVDGNKVKQDTSHVAVEESLFGSPTTGEQGYDEDRFADDSEPR